MRISNDFQYFLHRQRNAFLLQSKSFLSYHSNIPFYNTSFERIIYNSVLLLFPKGILKIGRVLFIFTSSVLEIFLSGRKHIFPCIYSLLIKVFSLHLTFIDKSLSLVKICFRFEYKKFFYTKLRPGMINEVSTTNKTARKIYVIESHFYFSFYNAICMLFIY